MKIRCESEKYDERFYPFLVVISQTTNAEKCVKIERLFTKQKRDHKKKLFLMLSV